MIWIYIIIFGLWFTSIYIKHGYNISAFLLSLYLCGMISCEILFIYFPETIKYPQRISVLSILIHIVCMGFLLLPIIRFGNIIKIENIVIPLKTLDKYIVFIIIPSIISMAISISMIIILLQFPDMHAARQQFLDGSLEGSFVQKLGPIGYIVSLGKCCSSIALVLGFYRTFYLNKKNLISYLILISSLCYPLFTLSFAGRDGILRWMLLFIFCIILFKDYLSIKKNSKIWGIVGIVGCLGIFMLAKITNDRFNNTEGVTYSILRYIGEPYYIFSYGLERFGEDPMKDSIFAPFPIITQEKPDTTNLNDKYSADYYLNTFSTIVGGILMRIGVYKTIVLFAIVFFLLFPLYGKYNIPVSISLTKFIGFIIYYEVCLTGVFYYMYNDRFLQLAIIFYILLAYCLDKKTNYKLNYKNI